jgi:hypothetical protein
MNTFQRIRNSISALGMNTALSRAYVLIADCWFDIRYGTDTIKFSELKALTIKSANKGRGVEYQPTRILPLKKVLQQIQPMIPAGSVLVDLGSGKGRVLMASSEFAFREVRGIEFARELCDIARRNCESYRRARGTSTNIEIIESDVVDYPIKSDENVFFLFNPFDDVVLSRLLANIRRSLETASRKITIVYCNPKLNHVIEKQGRFPKVLDLHFWGYRFAVYSTAD